MPVAKVDCRLLPGVNLCNVRNADSYMGLDHPSFQTARDCLADYNRWVDDVVLPIAFQWIAEHRDEIRSIIDPAQWNDVGAVTAAALTKVEECEEYQLSLVKRAEFEDGLRSGTRHIEELNPVWNQISGEVHAQIERSFDAHKYVPIDNPATPRAVPVA